MKRATLRRFAGAPTFDLELELHRLDCLASHGGLENYDFLVAFRDALRSEPVLPAPWVTGHDIMALGVVQGPAVGAWRRRAYDAQLENRFPDRDSLLAWLAEEVRRER
jgi:poly(A) polymerase